MGNLKYWQTEIPEVKFLGLIRIAYYRNAGVLQFNLMRPENDGSLTIGKTLCLYEDSICRENLEALNFLMDILHLWRKRARAKYSKEITLAIPEMLDSIPENVKLENLGVQSDSNIAELSELDNSDNKAIAESPTLEKVSDDANNRKEDDVA